MTPFVSATIDVQALRRNLDAVRARAPHSRVMAVIKANAYGHGLVAVAQALDGADAFAVARVDEGLALRAAGITKPVILLEGVFEREQLELAAANRFALVVHIEEQIKLLEQAPAGAHFDIWLKLDSGVKAGKSFRMAFQVRQYNTETAESIRRPRIDLGSLADKSKSIVELPLLIFE